MMLIGRWLVALVGALVLAGCGKAPPEGFEAPPLPALLEIRGAGGEPQGWLFGTIHALPDGVEWRTGPIDSALHASNVLVVEVADLSDEHARARIFAELATSGEQPLLTDRVPWAKRNEAAILMEQGGFAPGYFHRTETWAAALMLAQVTRSGDSANGVDRALVADYPALRIVELEGATAQLRIFDSLPEMEQRDLLSVVVTEAGRARDDPLRLARAWYAGDVKALAAEQRRGLLADPELREALLTGRNEAWTRRIAALVNNKRKPFIAVGAAHLPGRDGLIAKLEERGYTLVRIQ